MNFIQIKNERDCYRCGGRINYGEDAVVIRMKHNGGVVIPQLFHPSCYLEWNDETFNNRLAAWKSSTVPRSERKRKPKMKMGRPKKYTNPTLARRIQASLFYHRGAGNQEKVQELELALSGLIRH